MKHTIAILILALSLFSCNNNNDNHKSHNTVRIPISNKDSIIELEKIISEIKVTQLETNKDNLIGIITKIIYTDNHIIIGDNIISNAIYMFNTNGKFIKQISSIGNGPGEYTSFTHITLSPDKKNIIIIDDTKGKAIYYSIDGDYIKDEILPYRSEIVEYINNNELAFSNTAGIYKNGNSIQNTFIISNKKGEIYNTYFPSTFTNEFNLVTHPDHLKVYNADLYYNPNLSDTIYHISKRQIVSQYIVDIENCNKPSKSSPTALKDYIDFIQNSKSFNGDFLITENLILIGLFPNGSFPILYNKQSHISCQIDQKYHKSIFAFLGKYDIINSYEKHSITAGVNANDFINIYNKMPQSEKTNLQHIKIEKDDNPIIFTYRLKTKNN